MVRLLYCCFVVLMTVCEISHCDLKPENILLKSLNKSIVKLIDFGSSCFDTERMYTYIQSRFYRAPEILLGLPYSCAIDMWSLGCICCELYTGYPLFPGENEHQQLLRQMEVLGLPPMRMITESTRRKQFFDARNMPLVRSSTYGKVLMPGSKPLKSAVGCVDPLFLSFVCKCLMWEPSSRFTPHQALQHEWIKEAQDTSSNNQGKFASLQGATHSSQLVAQRSSQQFSAISPQGTSVSSVLGDSVGIAHENAGAVLPPLVNSSKARQEV